MIDFRTLNVDMPLFDVRKVNAWIEAVAEAHDRHTGNLNYLFCDDEHILSVNREFLQHDYFTDIITFDYSRASRIEGDIVISLDTVRTNAEQVGQPYSRELLRVIIHGVLHLCGIGDKGPGEREIMERNENEALDLFDSLEI